MKTKTYLFILALALVFSCKPEIQEFSASKGNADFTTYVAIGNSLTSGYADGDLYITGQNYSYPNILSQQFKQAGGGEFKQPMMFDEFGFGNKRVLGPSTDCKGVTSLAPIMAGPGPNIGQNMGNIGAQGPFNNMGVPGMKSFHLAYPGYGTKNPYFGRFASNPATASVLSDALRLNHTFFSYWVGNNDVLLYALGGGKEGTDSITPASIFNATMAGAVGAMIQNGAKGVLANIPNVKDIPYFNTVPAFGLVLDATQAGQLNAAYAPYNLLAQQQVGVPKIEFHAGVNAFIIQDNKPPFNMVGGLRQIKAGELICLSVPQDSLKCKGWGSQKPIPGRFFLDADELLLIQNATDNFNAYIKSLADENGLAFVDMNAHFQSMQSGISYDGIKFTTTFVTGGLFSLDGIHPNPRGSAIIANYFIDAINAKYAAKIPKVNISDYPGIVFP